jgi:hypothetical protein
LADIHHPSRPEVARPFETTNPVVEKLWGQSAWNISSKLRVGPSLSLESARRILIGPSQVTDETIKVSLRMAFSMTNVLNVEPTYHGFIIETNGRDWTVNIMMLGETALALVAGHEPLE